MKNIKPLISFVLVLLFIGGCSTKKDTFPNRTYHNVTAKYNVLYNGNVALEKGILELNNTYQDNFWEILPVEPIEIQEENLNIETEASEETNKSSFGIAEEKAVKTVQKHGMYIQRTERNKQIDDAYFLLGKARYYSQRFVPALESFDFSLKYNPQSELHHIMQIWKSKTQIRLQNEESGTNALKFLLAKSTLKKDIKEQAHTALAMGYLALDSIPEAIDQLKLATETSEYKDQNVRNSFILGQLYINQSHPDSAFMAFQKITENRKAPLKYKIHAYLELANLDSVPENLSIYEQKLHKYAKDPLNKAFNDEIYYGIAQLSFKNGADEEALAYLSKSTAEPLAKKFQKVLSYEKLGDYFYDKGDFLSAATYYDSIIPNIENKNTKHIRKLIRKQEGLTDVLAYENSIKYHDSILNLVKMAPSEREDFFNAYIEKLKRDDKIAEIQKENAANYQSGSGNALQEQKKNSTSAKFYFYNPQAVGFGKDAFQRVWGNRALKDNWRWSQNETASSFVTENINIENTVAPDTEQKYNVDFYIKIIPTDPVVIAAYQDIVSHANYELGLIYKEKLKEYDLAAMRLERFLKEKPKEHLILPAKYHLFKIYEILGDPKSDTYKNDIVQNYPKSKYAQLLLNTTQNPDTESKITPEAHYELVYCDFELEKYAQVVTQCDQAILAYADHEILPKFELLKSFALFHTKGKEQMIEGLEYIITNHPKTEEAIHAQEVLDLLRGVVKKVEESHENSEIKSTEKKPKEPKVKTLNEEEKKKKVLEMMKQQNPPGLEEK